MFRATTGIAFFFFCTVAYIAYLDHARLRPDEQSKYLRFLAKNESLASSQQTRPPVIQYREDVRKDFFIPKGIECRHVLITGSHSELTVDESKRQMEVVEELKGFKCWIIDDVKANMEQVRYITATEGTYFYPSHDFLSKDANIEMFYRKKDLSQDSLEKGLFFKGRGMEVAFSLCQQSPQLYVKQFQATLNPTMGIR